MNHFNNNLYKIIFSFLSAVDLKKNHGVNKQWKAISEGILDKTKDQVYYITGDPIEVTQSKWYVITINPYEYKRFKSTISPAEIAQSYPQYRKIRLFAAEREALDFSLFKRVNYHKETLSQPSVFKVHFPHKISCLKYRSAILQIDRDKSRQRYIYFFETDCKNVIPIEGKLKVESLVNDEVIEYKSIDYQTFTKEKNKKSICTIM